LFIGNIGFESLLIHSIGFGGLKVHSIKLIKNTYF
jgi:hypothetical protein